MAWLRARPDREHEITLNRFVISVAILVFTLFLMPVSDTAFAARLIAVIYLVSGTLLLVHLIWRPGISHARRVIGMFVDLILLSCGLSIGGESVSILYPFYYWIVLGNGFRYGESYLYPATVIAAVGFLAVVLESPYWTHNYMLAIGLLGGVVVVPLYAATLIRSLSRAKEMAEHANRAKSAFLTSVSHELRTPLNAIIGSGDLLRDTTLRRDQREMVEIIQLSSSALLSQINDLIDLSSIESGEMKLKPGRLDLIAMMSGVRDVGAVQARAKDIRFHLHITPRTPAFIEADERRIREILINLIGNAIKFTEQGSVTLSADALTRGGQQFLYLEVSDTGIGIADEEIDRIFLRFTQANSTILNRFGGTGLGLAIVQELVKLQNGNIEVRSQLGQGSNFSLTLPVAFLEEPVDEGSLLSETKAIILDPLNVLQNETREKLASLCGQVATCATPEQVMTQIILPAPDEIRHQVVLLAGLDLAWPNGMSPEDAVETLRAASPAGIFGIDMVSDELPSHAVRRLVKCVIGRDDLEMELKRAMRMTGRVLQAAVASRPGIVKRERALRILLADDNRVNQKVIGRILEAGGHFVTIATNGMEAVDAMEAGGIELVLMDLNMPGMDGLEATKLYRMMALGQAHLPIIGLTADATASAAENALGAGMDACLTKPVNGPILLDHIDELYEKHAPAATAGQQRAVAGAAPSWPVAAAPPPPPPPIQSNDGGGHVDTAMLKNLETLGGPSFVAAVISDFLTDGSALLLEMREVVEAGDVAGYAEKAHALQSGAGNIGVLKVAEDCRNWRPKSAEDLMARGPAVVEGIERDFETARSILLRQHARRPLLISDREVDR
ncbi:response regulator [Aureimonas fodinaquatilis]|uniref:histidine kinase n=1 Tax=Aureimonas fodinaquatilis TaxID=2565783 RepID=A0A5B0DVL3_9HYPH|nr:hybrid sensor histidine kinase/response regulator [Aureimonas fodinaquatilis]KAA0970516.1 response regulator [Aureimonas fodinaquatilis]